ncbi:hypothetical protein [Bradyrhizobium arachidis]|uniref:Uncharacterized protein n=1 Tax=Bradyrhizobium arachidis TaxID=858423 RepID=A0AAE7TGU6_9BRAD|nr:hypothetical protein [Bradyrhizobium arachidis]QOZ67151.1 hypothetical protein WN72_13125 [Bradyrhizobium arachidis]SFV15992.1 hypothetical protein SAMN05192541_124111 [Bradyrhizobium arachidis]
MPDRSKLGPDDFAAAFESAPEDPRTLAAREELERWQAFAAAPWAKPETLMDAIRQASERRTIWLLEAIDIMAFGTGEPPQAAVEAAARRLQACRALCRAAADGTFTLIGMLGERSERVEAIALAYFDADYRIGRGSNVLELDASSVPPQDDAKFDRMHLARWFDVRVGDKEAFLAWLTGRPTQSADILEQATVSKDHALRSRKGQGSFAAMDEDLLEEMERLIVGLKVASVQAAADSVADRAYGGGARESKARRLARAYRKRER